MKCPSCGFDNIDGVDECATCQETFAPGDADAERDLSRSITNETLAALDPQPVIAVDASTPLAEVMRLLAERNIGCVLVMSGDALLGIFSERDVLRRIGAHYHERAAEPIRTFMTAMPETLTMDDSIAFALNRMDVNGFRHIPVVQDGRVAGIISVRDVLAYITRQFPELTAHAN